MTDAPKDETRLYEWDERDDVVAPQGLAVPCP